MPTVKPRRRAGTYDVFQRRYDPIPLEDDSLIREWNDPELQDVDEHYLWTVVDCDGRLMLTPGYASVNYLGRVLCRKPWDDVEWSNPGYVY